MATRSERRDVQGRVLTEEADGHEMETRVLDGHDRPVLGAGDVGHAERVPGHDLGTHQ